MYTLNNIMESIVTITPATVPCVSTNDIIAHLRLNEGDDESDLLDDWVAAAAEKFANDTGYVLTDTVLALQLDAFPCTNVIYIPRQPVISVTSVEYLNASNSWTTISSGTYKVDLNSMPARIVFSDGYPSPHATYLPVVKVTFHAGLASASNCPRLAIQAIKLLVAYWYGQREAFSTVNLNEVPAGWKAVCDNFKMGKICNLNEVS